MASAITRMQLIDRRVKSDSSARVLRALQLLSRSMVVNKVTGWS